LPLALHGALGGSKKIRALSGLTAMGAMARNNDVPQELPLALHGALGGSKKSGRKVG